MWFMVNTHAWKTRESVLRKDNVKLSSAIDNHLMASYSSDLHLHCFYFQAFGEELEVRQSDFESVRSQGDRLICQLADETEREALSKRMHDIANRFDRIQHLLNDRDGELDAQNRSVRELNGALNDCNGRVEHLKASLRELQNLESFQGRLQQQVRLSLSGITIVICSPFHLSCVSFDVVTIPNLRP